MPLDNRDSGHPKPAGPKRYCWTKPNRSAGVVRRKDAATESGTAKVYVRPFTGSSLGQSKWQISVGVGSLPTWAPAGPWLFYPGADSRMMVIGYEAQGEGFRPGKPRVWLDKRLGSLANIPISFDVTPDGDRLVILAPAEKEKREGNLHATFLLNFLDELKCRVPSAE
jgi:hypothetical protein